MRHTLLLIICMITIGSSYSQPTKAKTDSAEIRTTIMNFYNWYNANYRRFEPFKLYYSTKTKDAPPYRINWKEAERYFAFIRKSVPQLGEAFIKNQRTFFMQCDSAFKVDVEDELPYGFDYDWYTNSQEEPQYLVDQLKKAKQWIINVKGILAEVTVLGTFDNNGKEMETVIHCVKLEKEKGKWKIATIGCPEVPSSATEQKQQ